MSRFVGFDLGTDKSVGTVATVENAVSAKLLRNTLEHDTTPTVVAFTSTQRLVGEAARDQLRLNPRNAIADIPRLLGLTVDEYEAVTNGEHVFATVAGGQGARCTALRTPPMPGMGRNMSFVQARNQLLRWPCRTVTKMCWFPVKSCMDWFWNSWRRLSSAVKASKPQASPSVSLHCSEYGLMVYAG
jgi:Hsp70 protein